MGKSKGIIFMLLDREDNYVAFCELIMKTKDCFGLS
jgi:uncharacterized membrane protein